MATMRPRWLTLPVIPTHAAGWSWSTAATFSSQISTAKSPGASAARVVVGRSPMIAPAGSADAASTSALNEVGKSDAGLTK